MAEKHAHGRMVTLIERVTVFRPLGMAAEWAWWSYWLARKRFAKTGIIARKFRPDNELPSLLAEYLDGTGPWRILDVGSGPLTTLGARTERGQVEIVATDPLARWYNLTIRVLRQRAPFPAVHVAGERLRTRFPDESFDISHAQNSLDHASEPMAIIEQMLAVTKIGGAVILVHHPDEAERAGYTGLHRWNFSEKSGRFLLASAGTTIDVGERLSGRGTVTTKYEPAGDWIVVTITRTA